MLTRTATKMERRKNQESVEELVRTTRRGMERAEI
jgi:hypothetical protein